MLVFHALQHPMYQDIETVVRINPLSTPFGLLDLEAAVRAGVDVIRLPKTDTPDDIYELEGHRAYRARVRPRSRLHPRDGGD
jgi:citrate lyase subunit beta/citryl-CoA lyase